MNDVTNLFAKAHECRKRAKAALERAQRAGQSDAMRRSFEIVAREWLAEADRLDAQANEKARPSQ